MDQAYACKKCLTEILDFEMSCYNKDQFTAVGKKLTTAWKVSFLFPLSSSCFIILHIFPRQHTQTSFGHEMVLGIVAAKHSKDPSEFI